MFQKIASLAALSTIATGAFAAGTGPDLTPLTSAVDFGTVITAVLAIAGLLAGVYVAIKGAKIVIGMVRGA
ncbi:major capsid protein [Chromobacterium vaccinii]|uniref:major capsid protein n=1 Tax=Chromobacterium vaccinii TaxID=1108595 RepID=UPI001E3EDA77|nr:major capsid protein [Chromobacterium vaccinii]MCD4500159.1 major capsid protein [Chromobacterium vaccinii]